MLLQYPTNDRENPSYAVAQLPLEAVTSLPLETVMSNDIITRTARYIKWQRRIFVYLSYSGGL